jgi:hypothetical protein
MNMPMQINLEKQVGNMPNFDALFSATKERPIIYKGDPIIRSDRFPVSYGEKLIISIEKTNSEWRQGVCIDVTGSCELEGELINKGKGINMLFWEDTAPKQIELTVFTKKGYVVVKNIWEYTNVYLVRGPSGESVTRESKSVESWYNGAAMKIEEIENGRRYFCNDGHPDDNFDDIVFTVRHEVRKEDS